jgi:hypothetical protein
MKELRELYNWMCEMDKLDKKPNFYDIKIKAVNLLNKQEEAINYTHCCTELVCDFCDENNLIKVGKELMPCTICQK